ncbi:MAG: Trp biosynthesis-associated membrane protein [Nocardioides sp.]
MSGRGATPGFARTMAIGLLATGAVVLAAHRPWLRVQESTDPARLIATGAPASVSALAWVSLAAWGAFLVTRGRFRRTQAILAGATALGIVVVAVRYGAGVDSLVRAGGADEALPAPRAEAGPWWWLCALASLIAAAVAAVAWRKAPGWPEMSGRYDRAGAPSQPDLASPIDVWRALDAGRDPTDPPGT